LIVICVPPARLQPPSLSAAIVGAGWRGAEAGCWTGCVAGCWIGAGRAGATAATAGSRGGVEPVTVVSSEARATGAPARW
jgi:hypothetical protein